MGNVGPIQINGTDVFIGDDGSVSVDGAIIDNLLVVDFPQPYQLNKVGDGLFEAEPGMDTPVPAGQLKLRQGYLESSNVESVNEMVRMIELTRNFETNQKAIQIQDTTIDKAINDVGRVK